MPRRFLAILLIALALVTAVVYAWAVMSPLTLSIGSAAPTLAQAGPVVVGITNPATATLPVASTPGTTLLVYFLSLTQPITTAPAGFSRQATVTQSTNLHAEAWLYPNNPGGILAASFTTASMDIGGFQIVMTEWSAVRSTSSLETSGTATATAGTTLAPTAGAAVVNAGDLVISMWSQLLVAGATVTFTTPSGYTRAVDNGSLLASGHTDMEYQVGAAVGSIPGPTLTSSVATTVSAVGIILVLKAAPPVVDQTAYLAY